LVPAVPGTIYQGPPRTKNQALGTVGDTKLKTALGAHGARAGHMAPASAAFAGRTQSCRDRLRRASPKPWRRRDRAGVWGGAPR